MIFRIGSSAWKKIYRIILDFTSSDNGLLPLDLLLSDLEYHLPSDKGMSVIKMVSDIPFCIRWPDYSERLIQDFNTRLNRIAPHVYSPTTHLLGPVNWRDYSKTEYDADFNIPLHIRHSLGFEIYDSQTENLLLFCFHRSGKNGRFSDEDARLLMNLRPLLQNIFTQKSDLLAKNYSLLLPREQESGCRRLSPRERTIIQYLGTRLSMDQIARELGISRRTVETHALHIYQKLCISSRKDLAGLIYKKKN